jgi:hypothetical protein
MVLCSAWGGLLGVSTGDTFAWFLLCSAAHGVAASLVGGAVRALLRVDYRVHYASLLVTVSSSWLVGVSFVFGLNWNLDLVVRRWGFVPDDPLGCVSGTSVALVVLPILSLLAALQTKMSICHLREPPNGVGEI